VTLPFLVWTFQKPPQCIGWNGSPVQHGRDGHGRHEHRHRQQHRRSSNPRTHRRFPAAIPARQFLIRKFSILIEFDRQKERERKKITVIPLYPTNNHSLTVMLSRAKLWVSRDDCNLPLFLFLS
jgi:hypothetical protein